VAEAKIEVLEYVELIGSASQNGNNIYVFYLQKENADHISILSRKKGETVSFRGGDCLPGTILRLQSSKSSHH